MKKIGAWLWENRWILLSLAASIAVLCFIYGNSMEDGETSGSRSEVIAQEIKPILDPEDRVSESAFHTFTRKMAHWTEFCALGVCLGGLACAIRRKRGHASVFMPLFFTLLAAVADEYLQSFTGRTSMVRDVLIDFGGALVGVLLIHAVVVLLSHILRGRKSK